MRFGIQRMHTSFPKLKSALGSIVLGILFIFPGPVLLLKTGEMPIAHRGVKKMSEK